LFLEKRRQPWRDVPEHTANTKKPLQKTMNIHNESTTKRTTLIFTQQKIKTRKKDFAKWEFFTETPNPKYRKGEMESQ